MSILPLLSAPAFRSVGIVCLVFFFQGVSEIIIRTVRLLLHQTPLPLLRVTSEDPLWPHVAAALPPTSLLGVATFTWPLYLAQVGTNFFCCSPRPKLSPETGERKYSLVTRKAQPCLKTQLLPSSICFKEMAIYFRRTL